MLARITLIFAGVVVCAATWIVYYWVFCFFAVFLSGIQDDAILSMLYWFCFAGGAATAFFVIRPVWPKAATPVDVGPTEESGLPPKNRFSSPDDQNRTIHQPENTVEPIANAREPHSEVATARLGCVFLVLALILSCLSFMNRCESWGEVTFIACFNFLVIAPLWAGAAIIYTKGKARIVLAIVAFVLPATMLSMIQPAILAARQAMPRSAITMNHMLFTFERIQAYAKAHRQIPPSLTALPAAEGEFDKAVDGWDSDFQYAVDRDGIITLTSFGADGQPGGEGRDADIVMRYRTRNADGTLNVDDENWITNAKIE